FFCSSPRRVFWALKESSRSRGRARQHARRVRYPDPRHLACIFVSSFVSHSRMCRSLRADSPKLRSEWRRVLDCTHAGNDRALVREAEEFHRRTFGKKCDHRKIATQDPEEIKLSMREIDDPIAIQIELIFRFPKIPDSTNCPQAARNI